MPFSQYFEALVKAQKAIQIAELPLPEGKRKLEGAQKEAAEKKRQERLDAAKKEAEDILNKASDEEKIYLERILTSKKQTYPVPQESEQFGKYFNQERYDQLLLYCQLAYLEEGNGIPEEHALKLCVAFNNVDDAFKYLLDFQKENQSNKKTNKQAKIPLVHDACLFQLPDPHKCDFSVWQKLIKRNMGDKEFRKLLPQAPEIERVLKQNEQKLTKDEANDRRVKIEEQKNKVEAVNIELKKLKRRHGDLDEEEEEKYEEFIKDKSNLLIQLYHLSKGFVRLEEADKATLAACQEFYILNSSASYAYMLKNGLTKEDYQKFLLLERADDDTQIPPVTLDGKDYGLPGIYLMKVVVMDEAQAARAACFGKLTGCCQSLSGEAGEPCAIHGLTNKYGGFYVACRGDVDNPKIEDEVLGQCWAWRGQDGAMVFDSVEKKPKSDSTPIKVLYNALATKLVEEKNIPRVLCGSNSGISSEFGIEVKSRYYANPIDYTGYRDSHFQHIISDPNRPYLFEKAIQKTQQWLEKQLQFELASQPYFIEMLNFIAVQKEENSIRREVELLINDLLRDDLEKNKKFEEIFQDIKTYVEDSESVVKKWADKNFPDYMMNISNRNDLAPLHIAIQKEYLDQAKFLIDKGASLDLQDANGNTPLHLAIQYNRNDIAKYLIKKGVRLSQYNTNGTTPLHLAIQYGRDDVAKSLIEKGEGVGLDLYDINSYTPLHTAVIYDKKGIVETLIENGALLDLQDRKGNTPLCLAISYGRNDIAKVLIEKGAALNLLNKYKHNLFDLAIRGCSLDIVRLLIQHGVQYDLQKNGNDELLHWAVKEGKVELANFLIQNGASQDAQDNDFNTPLHIAIKNNKIDLAKLLIENGAQLDILNYKGMSPFYMASKNGNVDQMKVLIENGASLDLPSMYERCTPLHMAAKDGNIAVAKLLIEKGARLDLLDIGGNTPLFYAIYEGHNEIAKALIENGSPLYLSGRPKDVLFEEALRHCSIDTVRVLIEHDAPFDLQDANGNTPLSRAINANNLELAKLLIEKGARLDSLINGFSLLHLTMSMDMDEITKLLIENGAPLNLLDPDGNTVVHWLVYLGKLDGIKLLIEKGASLDLSDKYGNTPLHIAILNNRNKLTKLLIESGANLNIPDKDGNTPLHLAIKKGKFELAKFLIEKGARLDCQNFYGNTPLHLATGMERVEQMKVLLEKSDRLESPDEESFIPREIRNEDKEKKKLDLAKLLIEKGSPLDKQNIYGNTPLHFATGMQIVDIAKALIEKGASLEIKNKKGVTPLDMVVENKNPKMEELFLTQFELKSEQVISSEKRPSAMVFEDSQKILPEDRKLSTSLEDSHSAGGEKMSKTKRKTDA